MICKVLFQTKLLYDSEYVKHPSVSVLSVLHRLYPGPEPNPHYFIPVHVLQEGLSNLWSLQLMGSIAGYAGGAGDVGGREEDIGCVLFELAMIAYI